MSRRRYQYIGLAVGAAAFVVVLVVLFGPNYYHLTSPGPMNTGHEDLSCTTCHRAEIGTVRQRLQAQVRYWLGDREDWVHLSTLPVTNEVCMACHDFPDDRHPVHRFREPRFSEVRQTLGVDQCVSCHEEHNGVRVTQAATFCSHCHEDTRIVNDPLDIPHETLFAEARWETCLTCHDYHGNHIYQVPSRMDDAFPLDAVSAYLAGEAELYSTEKRWPARTEADLVQ